MFNSANFVGSIAVCLRVKSFWDSVLHQWVTTTQGFGGSVQEFVLDVLALCPMPPNFGIGLHTVTLSCPRMESSYWIQFVHDFVDENKIM